MKAIAIASLLLGGIAVCSAQNVMPIDKQGSYSLGFMFDYFSPSGGTAQTSIQVNPAYFVTNNFSIGIPLEWDHESGSDFTSIGAEVRFFFTNSGNGPQKQFQPFVGAEYIYSKETGDPNDTFWAGELGAHYFVANNVAVTGVVSYGQDKFNGTNTNETEVFAGFTIFFAGK